ncbi:hypothetical protein SAMN05444413_11487 [Roseivivax marinus]|uniref:hypothetical protein n=1 Tax=Roseivivax marinus TaxID=1379903 RepID=UPI0008B2F692|nr:hypothetical protein [Roseivivax marinus]SEL72388.1 hypothetical protein SAMN05444413_11487 [Roseivivax marinus]
MTAHGPVFERVGDHPPLFFLHIPKTSGSAQNAVIQSIWGEAALVHAESWFNEIRFGRRALIHADAVSGHIAFSDWLASGLNKTYPAATVLRDPWERLVSHLNWMDRFNHGIDPGTRDRLPARHIRVVDALAEVEIDDAKSVARMRDRLTEAGDIQLFDNLQVRMTVPVRLERRHAVSEAHVSEALESLRGFAFVASAREQAAVAAWLANHAGANQVPVPRDTPVNPARSSRVRVGNAQAREALRTWWMHDHDLVQAALPRRAGVVALFSKIVGRPARHG